MFRRLLPALALVLGSLPVLTGAAPAGAAPAGFVQASGGQFTVDGNAFRFGGTNNYYLAYKPTLMADDVLDDAKAMGLTVVRTWAFIDRGSLDGRVSDVDGPGKDGVYFQYWDTATGRPAYNDGPNGLQRLDYVLAAARARGLRLILPMTNNWRDFGGMDQFTTWYGLANHDDFYTDARVRQAYKDWISHLLNRVNSITGVRYRDDPTVFSWELANEPRCINANKPTSGRCTADTLVAWADEMSRHVKSVDPNHMVSVGDEGFLNRNGGSDWPYNATDGVDHERLTALPSVDFGTFHAYPDGGWGRSPAVDWGTKWVRDHTAAAAVLGKPTVLEEFGLRDRSVRDAGYRAWTDAVRTGGGAGWMFWILSGIQPDGSLYPDFDGFTVYLPGPTATLLTDAARAISEGNTQPPDTAPPTAPGQPVVGARSFDRVTLTWPAATDNVGVTGYDVLRRDGATDTRVAQVSAATATVTGLAPGTAYTFVVRARDLAGNVSPASPAVAATTTPAPASGCRVAYVIQSQWQDGFVADVRITNLGITAITGWTLAWTFPGDQRVTNSWNTRLTQNAAQVGAQDAGHNATIAPAATVAFGFQATYSGGNAAPTAFTLDGVACT